MGFGGVCFHRRAPRRARGLPAPSSPPTLPSRKRLFTKISVIVFAVKVRVLLRISYSTEKGGWKMSD